MKRSTLIICLIFLIALNGCKRYYMANMLGEDNIDVTYLVVEKQYKPIYCKENICQLINPHPNAISTRQLDTIYKYTSIRLSESKISFDTDSLFVAVKGKLLYKYTYLMTYDPVDVFYAEFCIGDYRINEEIRIEKNVLLLPNVSDETRWKVSLCSK